MKTSLSRPPLLGSEKPPHEKKKMYHYYCNKIYKALRRTRRLSFAPVGFNKQVIRFAHPDTVEMVPSGRPRSVLSCMFCHIILLNHLLLVVIQAQRVGLRSGLGNSRRVLASWPRLLQSFLLLPVCGLDNVCYDGSLKQIAVSR